MTPALHGLLANGDQGLHNPNIPTEHWPMIMHRIVENSEPLRAVAQEYGVSYETISRVMLLIQKQCGQQEASPDLG